MVQGCLARRRLLHTPFETFCRRCVTGAPATAPHGYPPLTAGSLQAANSPRRRMHRELAEHTAASKARRLGESQMGPRSGIGLAQVSWRDERVAGAVAPHD